MRLRALFDEVIGLQMRLALPVRYGAERRGDAVARLAMPDWQLQPVIGERELRALEGDGFAFPPDLARIYTEVGNGVRYGGEELVAADVLARAWRETRDTPPDDEPIDDDPRTRGVVLVPIRGVEPAYDFLCIGEHACEVWHGTDEDYPTPAGSFEPWFEQRLSIWIAQLARAEAEVPRLRAELEAIDFTQPAAAFETIYRVEPRIVREAYYPLAALRAAKLATLIDRVPRAGLDRELAERIEHELFDKHHWALAVAFGASDERLGVSYWKLGRPADALPCFERAAVARHFHTANIARCLLALGRLDEAVRVARGCVRDHMLVHDVVGQVELAAGNARVAEEAFAAAIAAQQGNYGIYAEPYLHLGQLHLDHGRLDEARRLLFPEYKLGWLAQRREYHELLARLCEAGGDREAVALALAQAAGPDLETWQS